MFNTPPPAPPANAPKPQKPQLETLIPEAEADVKYARDVARIKHLPIKLNLTEFAQAQTFTNFYDSLLTLDPNKAEKLGDIVLPAGTAGAADDAALKLTTERQAAAQALMKGIHDLKDKHTRELNELHQKFDKKVEMFNKAFKDDPEVKLNKIEELRAAHTKELTDIQGKHLHEISSFYEKNPENKAHLEVVYQGSDTAKIQSEQTKEAEKLHNTQKKQLKAEYDAARDQEAAILAFIRQQAAAAYTAGNNPGVLGVKEAGLRTGNAEETILPPLEQIKTRHANIMSMDDKGVIRQTVDSGILFTFAQYNNENIRDQILFALAQPDCRSITIFAKYQTWGQYFDGKGKTTDDEVFLRKMWIVAKEIDPDLEVKGYDPTPDDLNWLREYREKAVSRLGGKPSQLSILTTLEALYKNIAEKLLKPEITGLLLAFDPNRKETLGAIKQAISTNESIFNEINFALDQVKQLEDLYSKEDKGELTKEHKTELYNLATRVNVHLNSLKGHQDNLEECSNSLGAAGHSKEVRHIEEGRVKLTASQQSCERLMNKYEEPAPAPKPAP